MNKNQLIKGAVYGALIGDACGVPYEFKSAAQLPPYDLIDMVPPSNFKRSWDHIEVGTYSDDGAQLLCLFESLLKKQFDAESFKTVLRSWLYAGYMSVDRLTFDVGTQTAVALQSDTLPVSDESKNGNGSLMRSLPVGLLFDDKMTICHLSHVHSSVTHPHERAWLCCALYSLIVRDKINGIELLTAIDNAFNFCETTFPQFNSDIQLIKQYEQYEQTGSGYVIDSFWSALKAVWSSHSYEDCIKRAILFGDDTDTTACIAGGLAGIKYGFDGIPARWVDLLRNKEQIDQVLQFG